MQFAACTDNVFCDTAGVSEVDRSDWFRWPQSYRERSPLPELAPYVSCVWVQEVAPDSPPFAFQAGDSGLATSLVK